MVNNKIAQRAVAAGLSGLMAFGAAAPAALAYTNYNAPFKWVKTTSSDDSTHWKRLAGNDRYGTMKKIVESYNEVSLGFWESIRKGFNNKDYYNYHSTVVLASGDNYPDALAANGLAGYLTNINLYQGDFQSVPVLITKSNSLSTETKDLLKGMQVQNVIIMGGTAAVSQDVEEAINKMGIGTSRVAGKDRQETSVKAMQRINGNWESRDKTYDLIIASGSNYADALSISPYAYRMGTPIILTDKDGKLTDQEVEAIKANDKIKEIVIVGGTEAVKDDVLGQIGTIKNNRTGINVIRVAGADRYETSAKIAEFELNDWSRYAWLGGFTFDHAVVATGENFPDALVGGQLAGGVMMPNIDVEGFTVADLNAWTPCPLLLTKDGNMQADAMIAAGIAKYRVSTGTDTYASFGSWLNTLNGWYDGDVVNDKVIYQTLANDWYLEATPKFISERAIDYNLGAGWSGTGQQIRNDGTSDIDITLHAKFVKGATKDEDKYQIFIDGVYDGDASHVVTTMPIEILSSVIENAHVEGENDSRIHEIALGTKLTWASDVHNVSTTSTGNITLKLTHAQWQSLVDEHTFTYTQKDVDWVRSYKDPTARESAIVANGWKQEIIGYVDSDDDFYGIILGGKKAVSNDKRDDLEKTVKQFSNEDQIFTVGSEAAKTIQLVDEHGVRNTYAYLEPVKSVSWKATPSVDSAIVSGYKGDVYHIYGTDSYVVAVFDKAGDLYTWLYYYGGTTQLYTDWQ